MGDIKTWKILQIDETWSITYDHNNNDKPISLFHYEDCVGDMEKLPNYVYAMIHRLIELEDEI